MKNSYLRILSIFLSVIMLCSHLVSCGNEGKDTDNYGDCEQNTTPFKNPVSPHDAPDPFMTYDRETGYYYALFTLSDRLEIYRSRHAGSIIKDGDSKVVYRANAADSIYGSIWAAEMHKGNDGKWYIYTSAKTHPINEEKHLFVIQAQSNDPFGEWKFMNILTPDIFCIDPTVYTAYDGKQYLCYSRVDVEYGQVLEMCEMITPYLCASEKVTIARAELSWECVSPYTDSSAILEGAFFLERKGRLFIVYSANGCWSNHYALGFLVYTGGDICDANSWEKHPIPLLTYGNGVYGPGHASFFESPDGSEIWCAYHGMMFSNDNATPAVRFFNLQRVDFNLIGFPVMGKPVGYDTEILPPSGERK